MKKRILICGDSWTRSWFKPEFISKTFLHRNIHGPSPKRDFFDSFDGRASFNSNSFQIVSLTMESMGFDVVDISEPGSSNIIQIDRLRKYYREYGDNNFDYILLYHTAPCRDISSARLAKKPESKIPYKPVPYTEGAVIEYGMHVMSPERFNETVDEILMNFYRELDKTQRNFYPNTKILFLGGAGSVKSELIERVNNKNFKIVMNSITEFIIKKVKENNPSLSTEELNIMQQFSQHPEISCSGWVHLIDESWNPVLINYIHDIWENRLNLMTTEISNFFYPDKSHPSSDAIFYVLDQLCKYIEDLEGENGP